MPIRVDHTVAPQISRDTAQKQKLFFPDLANEAVRCDSFQRASNSVLSIATSDTEALSLGDVTDARGLYLEVNVDCYVRINGGIENIPVKLAPSASIAKLFLEADLNAVEVENLSADTVLQGAYCFWGDPIP